jgi:hypothetical protein
VKVGASIQDMVQEITLRIGQMGVQRALDEKWLFAERPEIRTRFVIEEMKTMLMALVRYAEQPCRPITYPADWWHSSTRARSSSRSAPARSWPTSRASARPAQFITAANLVGARRAGVVCPDIGTEHWRASSTSGTSRRMR